MRIIGSTSLLLNARNITNDFCFPSDIIMNKKQRVRCDALRHKNKKTFSKIR